MQTEMSDLMKSLGEPLLLGLTDAEQDPAQQLLEPEATAVRRKHPLLIPDFISTLPLVLHEDRETILGTSGDAKIILKSSNEKKLSLDKITFPQWSAANLRIMHTLMKEGSLSTTEEVLDYIMYIAKISELAKCYPLPRVMQYDDFFRRMQFATKCKWRIDSQFISQQTLHRPEPTTATPLARPIARHLAPSSTRPQGSKCAMNSRDERDVDLALLVDTTMSVSSPNVLGLTHSGSTYPLHPRTANTELTLPCRTTSDICFEPTTAAGGSSNDTLHTQTAECDKTSTCMSYAGPYLQPTQLPDAAQVSTDLILETWATELQNDLDKEFILSGDREGFHLLPGDTTVTPAFTKNNQSVSKPGAKDQIEAQIEQGLLDGHLALADDTQTPLIVNALGAVPKKYSTELRMIWIVVAL